MKNYIYGFLLGFSFFVTRWLIDNTQNDMSDKPVWMAYLLFPMLILIYTLSEKKGERR